MVFVSHVTSFTSDYRHLNRNRLPGFNTRLSKESWYVITGFTEISSEWIPCTITAIYTNSFV